MADRFTNLAGRALPRKLFVASADTPKTHTNFAATVGVAGGQPFNLQRVSAITSQNAFVEWDLTMEAGTWTLDLYYAKNTSFGIYTISLDGVSVGTIDSYAASSVTGNITSIAGIVVAAGVHALRLTMATKNASSSDYVGIFNAVSMVRTGA